MSKDQESLESIKTFMSPANAGRFFGYVLFIGSFLMTVSVANAALHPLDWHTAMYIVEVMVCTVFLSKVLYHLVALTTRMRTVGDAWKKAQENWDDSRIQTRIERKL